MKSIVDHSNLEVTRHSSADPPKAKPPPKMRQKGSGGRIFLIAAILCLLVALAGIITVIVIYEIRNVNKRQVGVTARSPLVETGWWLLGNTVPFSWVIGLYFWCLQLSFECFDKLKRLRWNLFQFMKILFLRCSMQSWSTLGLLRQRSICILGPRRSSTKLEKWKRNLTIKLVSLDFLFLDDTCTSFD